MDTVVMVALITAVGGIIAAFISTYFARESRAENKELTKEIERLESKTPMLSPEEYGIVIGTPADYALVERKFEVIGSYRNLPKDHRIWLSTFKIDGKGESEQYWPQSAAKASNGTWQAQLYNIGSGEAGATKEFLVFVVGQDGDALFKYFGRVGSKTKEWPGITTLTSDVVECARGKIRLAEKY